MRNLDPAMSAALSAGVITPVLMAMLTFASSTQYVWSGYGTLVYDGQAFLGVGTLGEVGTITEGSELNADGTTVTLSGIDPTLYGECMDDIQLGAPAKIWFGLFGNGVLIGAPYLLFAGTVDAPTFTMGGKTLSIQLALENRLSDFARASCRRYTSADQRLRYPNDSAFSWVELENDIALRIGS